MTLSLLFSVNLSAFAVVTNTSSDGNYQYTLSDDKATITRYLGSSMTVNIPSVLDGYEVVAVGRSAFFMQDITTVNVPDTITSIGESAFHDCHSLTEINFGRGLTTIAKNAFYNCFYLTSLSLTASVSEIGADAFKDTERLTAITVDAGNQYYTAVDNVLFTKDMTTLMLYGAKGNTEYVVPDGVTTIARSAFFASKVKDITLPTTLTLIDTDAFDGNALETVRYDDTEAAWKDNVTIENDNDGNKIFFDETVNYVFKQEHQHTPAAAVRENEVPATCKAEGSYDEVIYCSECGDEISRETKTIDKLAHTPEAAVKENEVKATCQSTGSYDEVVYCSVCGTELSRKTVTTPKTGHTPKAAVKENEVKATYTKGGSYDLVVYCSVCGAELSREHKTTPKLNGKNGWYKVNGYWYLYKDNEMLKYWQKVDGKWYYMNSKGIMVTGWLQIKGVWYYLGTGGAMADDWRYINKKWYYFNKSGAMQTGWLKQGGNWYYLNPNGDMVIGKKTINGKTYTFDEHGVCQNP